MNLGALFTPLRVVVFSSLCLFSKQTLALNKKDYEGFSLPRKAVSTPIQSLYQSDRVRIKSKSVQKKSPSISHQQYFFLKETFLSEKRDEAIKLLRQEMEAGYKHNRDNMLLKLGQLYTEKYMELSYQEAELYRQKLKQFEKIAPQSKKTLAPTLDNERSQRYLKMALDVFLVIEKEFPRHPKIDEVYFFIGFVQLEFGNKKGLQSLEKVVRNYPKSVKYGEALLFLGDYYFEQKKPKEAFSRYGLLIQQKNSVLYHYGLYKKAWCELNYGSSERAVKDLKRLISELTGTVDQAKFNLREQAMKDLPTFYAEVGKIDELLDYYTKLQGKDKALENLKVVAELYSAKAKDKEAIRAHSLLLSEFPESITAPKWKIALFESYSRTGKQKEGQQHLLEALEKYGENSAWAKSFSEDKNDELKGTIEFVAKEGERAAYFYHQSAQKSLNKNNYKQALQLYKALAQNFPNLSDRRKILFYQGEILYQEGKWVEAKNAYINVAKIPPKDALSEEATYNAVLSMDRLLSKVEGIKRYSKEDYDKVSLTPDEIPNSDSQFLEVAEFYINEYPTSKHSVDVRFRIASTYYRYHHFDKAEEKFKAISISHPSHRSAMTAAHIVLDIYHLKKDYAALEKGVLEFLENPKLGDENFKKELKVIRSELSFKRIEGLERSENWKEAGTAYLEYYSKGTSPELKEKSLYNAIVCFEKALLTSETLKATKIFLSVYPKSEFTSKLLMKSAKQAESTYHFEEAQRNYALFYQKFPKDKDALNALYNAAVFAELLEKNGEAVRLYELYLREAKPKIDERNNIGVSLARIYAKQSNTKKASQSYRSVMNDSKTLNERITLLGEIGKLSNDKVMRNQIDKEIISLTRNAKPSSLTGVALNLTARAIYYSADSKIKKYESIGLQFPIEDLLWGIKRKQKFLLELGKHYDEIIQMGVPEWGVASLYRKSELYDHFVKSYRSVKIPKRFKQDERIEIEKQLKAIDEQMMIPLESKAKESISLCISKAKEFFVVSDTVQLCQSKSSDQGLRPSGIVPQPDHWESQLDDKEIKSYDSVKNMNASENSLEYLGYLFNLDASRSTNAEAKILKWIEENRDKRGVFLLSLHYHRNRKLSLAKYLYNVLEKSEDFTPKSYLYNNLGLISLSEGLRTLAIEQFERASQLKPPSLAAQLNLGALYLHSQNYAQAVKAFKAASKLDDESEDVALGLGSALEALGKFDDAHRVYDDFSSPKSDGLSILYNDSILLGNRLNQRGEASQKLLRYIQLGGRERLRAQEIIQSWR